MRRLRAVAWLTAFLCGSSLAQVFPQQRSQARAPVADLKQSTNRSAEDQARLLATGILTFDKEAPDADRSISADSLREAILKNSGARVTSAVVVGRLNCRYASFDKEVALTGCRFTEGVDFASATFQRNVLLIGSTYQKDCTFESAVFGGNLDLSRTSFPEGRAVFGGIQVQGMLGADPMITGELSAISLATLRLR